MTTTTTTTPATNASVAKKDPNFDLLAALGAFASNPSTETDSAKLQVPPQLNADDARLYTYVASTWVTGDASVAWRVKHAELARGIRPLAWTFAKAKIWNSNPVPAGVHEAEAETRALLNSRRALAVSQRREDQFERLLNGLAPAFAAVARMSTTLENVGMAMLTERAGAEAASKVLASATEASNAVIAAMLKPTQAKATSGAIRIEAPKPETAETTSA